MSSSHTSASRATLPTLVLWLAVPAWIACLGLPSSRALAQQPGPSPDPATATATADRPDQGAQADRADQGDQADLAEQAEPAAADLDTRLREAERMAEKALVEGQAQPAQGAEPGAVLPTPEKISFLKLLLQGRWLMLPIALMSLLVVAVGTERFLGLRRGKVLPSTLVAGLEVMAARPEGLDPRRAYQLCRRHPSAASKVTQAVLLKVGRPQGELERAISEAGQREAAELHSNVRWLNLAAAVTPLLGLLGTVWGMIQAFFETANMPVEANRAQVLAQGIWTALVTTFAGLSVAIPAAILAHYFEGRIEKLFREIDEALLGLLPKLERYEGRVRVTKADLERPDSSATAAATGAAPATGTTTAAAQEARRRKPTTSPK